MSAYIWYDNESINKLVSELVENSKEVRCAQFQEDMEPVYAEINANLTHGWLFKKTHPPVSTVSGAKEYFRWKKGFRESSWMDHSPGEWLFHRVAVANYHKRIRGDEAVTSGFVYVPWVNRVLASCDYLSRLKSRHSEVMGLKKKFNL